MLLESASRGDSGTKKKTAGVRFRRFDSKKKRAESLSRSSRGHVIKVLGALQDQFPGKDDTLSACPIPPVKKPRGPKAKVQPISRSRDEVAAEFSKGSSYADWSGWGTVARVMTCDMFSLSSGAACWALITYLVQQAGRSRSRSEKPCFEVEIYKPELALLIRTTTHTINGVLSMLAERKLAVVAHAAAERSTVRLVFDAEKIGGKNYPGWSEVAKVPYDEWFIARERAKAEELRDEADEHDAAADEAENGVKRGIVELTKRPRRVKPGHQEKPLSVTTGVRTYRMDLVEDEKAVDVSYTAAVHSGEFVATVCIPPLKTLQSTQHAKRADSGSYVETPGRPRPDNSKLPANVGSDEYPHVGVVDGGQSSQRGHGTQSNGKSPVQHPRATELSSLFDPFLLKSCGKSLSGDSVALLAACEAIQDVDHDFLVKVVVDRAARPISSPRAAVAICKEIAHNWKRAKDLPPGIVQPSRHDARNEQVLQGLKALNEMRRRKRDVA